ncbi:MAG: hypothetical protein M0R46_01310 [Candidatus Muirbacterium halophilum]|nr:hypothetical protein [Candidatus Muirbacterium halophilum]MCK9474532.1 hypothetical protein [Candidatus Muirbacterium halophilum]
MKIRLKGFIFIFLIYSINVFSADDFMKNSEITGKVMEFLGSIRYIRGDFKVINPSYTLTAGQGKVDEEKNLMEAYINVKLVQEKYTLECNKMIYYMDEEKAVATGEPIINETIKDTKETVIGKSKITGKRVVNYIKEDRVVVDDNVKIERFKFVDGKQELDYNLFCDNLTYYNNTGKALAIGNVRIERVDSTAYGDRLIFFEGENRIEIVGNASIERKTGDKVHGEKIIFFTEDERVIVFKAKAEVIPSSGASE